MGRDMGMVFQAYSLFPDLTVAENVAFGLRIRRRPKAEQTARVLVTLADGVEVRVDVASATSATSRRERR